jgi:hypothetical protein
MPPAEENQAREETDSPVWNAIAAFEQIIQTVPNDRISLDALSHAYEQVGDLTRAREYMVRLANVIVDEADRDAAETLRERLTRYAASDPTAKEAERRVEQFLASLRPGDAHAAGRVEPKEARPLENDGPASNVAAELSFAWNLFQAGELTQDEYASVAQDLSEISATKAAVTVSVLHILHDRGFRNLERVVAFASREARTPIIPLSAFDVQDAAVALLPLDFMERSGTMAFEMIGTDVLTVVLNPYNKALQKRVETLVGRKCHFYLTLPAEFDAVLDKIKDRNAKTGESIGEGPAAGKP